MNRYFTPLEKKMLDGEQDQTVVIPVHGTENSQG